MKEAVQAALNTMRDAENWLHDLGQRPGTSPDVAFKCGRKAGHLEAAEAMLRLHEERAERSRAAAAKARRRK